jgi:methanogenic corrinoid protein MtbC1
VSSIPPEAVDEYLVLAHASDHLGASELALDHLDDGSTVQEVLDDLLGAAQRESGDRWYRNEWTVVDEHLVTTTTVAVLEEVAAVIPLPRGEGELAVVCAEGDWHSLPARLFAEGMRSQGWGVTFLGASTPSDHVGEFLARRPPDALAVSCALPLNFRGAAQVVEVAHDVGVPVLVGGPAIDGREARGRALGADATAKGAHDAPAVLEALAGGISRSDGRPPVSLDRSALELDADALDLAEAAMASLRRSFPAMRAYDGRQLARTREDLAFTVRFAAAAILVDDPTVWTDFVDWQLALLAIRGVPAVAFVAGVEALVDPVTGISPSAGRAMRAVVDASPR